MYIKYSDIIKAFSEIMQYCKSKLQKNELMHATYEQIDELESQLSSMH